MFVWNIYRYILPNIIFIAFEFREKTFFEIIDLEISTGRMSNIYKYLFCVNFAAWFLEERLSILNLILTILFRNMG